MKGTVIENIECSILNRRPRLVKLCYIKLVHVDTLGGSKVVCGTLA